MACHERVALFPLLHSLTLPLLHRRHLCRSWEGHVRVAHAAALLLLLHLAAHLSFARTRRAVEHTSVHNAGAAVPARRPLCSLTVVRLLLPWLCTAEVAATIATGFPAAAAIPTTAAFLPAAVPTTTTTAASSRRQREERASCPVAVAVFLPFCVCVVETVSQAQRRSCAWHAPTALCRSSTSL